MPNHNQERVGAKETRLVTSAPTNHHRPKEGFLPNPKLKFLDQCREVMRFKQFSRRTEETYLQWIRRFILFHRKKAPARLAGDGKSGATAEVTRPTTGWIWRHPKDMGEVEVRAFLTDLAVKRGVVAATQNQALNALLFLYREVLGGEMAWVDGFERAKRSQRVPMVLSHSEVRGLLGQVWKLNDFRQWVETALSTVRELRKTLTEPGDLEWRAAALGVLRQRRLTAALMISHLPNGTDALTE